MSTQGFTYERKTGKADYAQACVDAVESIGGDPERVGELVAALDKAILDLDDYGEIKTTTQNQMIAASAGATKGENHGTS